MTVAFARLHDKSGAAGELLIKEVTEVWKEWDEL